MCTMCTAEHHPVIKRANSANMNESRRLVTWNKPDPERDYPAVSSFVQPKDAHVEEPKIVVTRPGERGRGRRR